MPATRSALSYDVFVAPEKPFAAPPPTVGDAPAWDPTGWPRSTPVPSSPGTVADARGGRITALQKIFKGSAGTR
jgi:hypothetical protein